MTDKVRLDKYLTDMGVGTRSEVKNRIRKGRVLVDGVVETRPETKISCTQAKIICDNIEIIYQTNEYYMLNKPAGVITATEDRKEKTVLELLPETKRRDLFPVGRLDKDTEGLLLITNDGALAHQLLSPRKHVAKTYYAKIDGRVTQSDINAFEEGVFIEEDVKTRPAMLEIQKSGECSEILLTIYEGKFHQVKRMFEAVDKKVIYLKRISMGSLVLDEELLPGEYRTLTKEETEALKERRGY